MAGTPLPLHELTSRTPFFTGPNAPSLNLGETGVFEYVVYVLRCKPQILGGPFTWYVGRVPRLKLAVRMKQHMAGSGADYTATNKPLLVEALYPAACRSVEAYAFFAMMERLPANAIDYGRLGGWTQTRPSPSATCKLLLREQKRMLSDSCLACGSSNHKVKDRCCPRFNKWPDSAPLDCGHCHATIDITALGSTRTRPPTLVPATTPPTRSSASSGARARPPEGIPAAMPPPSSSASSVKRPRDDASQVAAALPPKRPHASAPAPPRREFPRVKICGREYTTIAWYVGKYRGGRTTRALATGFGSHALDYKGCDHKTMVERGFAKTQRPPELLPGRTNLSQNWLETECVTVRQPHNPLQVRRGCSGRNLLWRVEDLAACFDA